MANKIKEDTIKQLKKLQSQLKDYQHEVDAANAARDDLANAAKEKERRFKSLEAELLQLHEDLAASERARKQLQAEKDELQEEINGNSSGRNSLLDEKRRLEARIAQLEEELDEEQGNVEVLNDRVRKGVLQSEQLTAELSSERSNSQKLDNERNLLDRQNKDLKVKLNELEVQIKTRSKAAMQALETKIANLEEQLEVESRERQNQAKINRKIDKRVKELMLQVEDERRLADQYKEQVDKSNARLKALKRQVEDGEEEMARVTAQKRKLQRDVEEQTEAAETSQRELDQMKAKMRIAGTSGVVRAPVRPRPSAVPGSTASEEVHQEEPASDPNKE